MTQKEVQKIIDGNVGKQLYLSSGSTPDAPISFRLHEPISKTRALKLSKFFRSVRISTFGEERPDLAKYLDRPNGRQSVGWDRQIVTFDATDGVVRA